jgi:hypothetical protein
VQVVTFKALAPALTLGNNDDVERWLGEVRRRLVELLELGPVRLLDREGD